MGVGDGAVEGGEVADGRRSTLVLRALWSTNIRARLESRELMSWSPPTPASALGILVDLLRISPSVSSVVPPLLPGGTATRATEVESTLPAAGCAATVSESPPDLAPARHGAALVGSPARGAGGHRLGAAADPDPPR